MNKSQSKNGFTMIEIMIVLVIGSFILMLIFFLIPRVQQNEQNDAKQHDVGILRAAIIRYIDSQPIGTWGLPDSNGCAPAPPPPGECSCGIVWEYNGYNGTGGPANWPPSLAQTQCPEAYDFISNLLPQMQYYRNLDQYFYALDAPLTDQCNNVPASQEPVIDGQPTPARTLNPADTTYCFVLYNNDHGIFASQEMFVDIDYICLGQYGYPNFIGWSANPADVVIVYSLATNGGTEYECENATMPNG